MEVLQIVYTLGPKTAPALLDLLSAPRSPVCLTLGIENYLPHKFLERGGQAPKLKDVFNYPPPPFFSFLPAKLKILNLPISSPKNNFIPRLLGRGPG